MQKKMSWEAREELLAQQLKESDARPKESFDEVRRRIKSRGMGDVKLEEYRQQDAIRNPKKPPSRLATAASRTALNILEFGDDMLGGDEREARLARRDAETRIGKRKMGMGDVKKAEFDAAPRRVPRTSEIARSYRNKPSREKSGR